MRAAPLAALLLAVIPTRAPRAEWRAPIAGSTAILPTEIEPGVRSLTVHAAPRREPAALDGGVPAFGWSQPLVDRRLSTGERAVPLDAWLLEAIKRIEPIYDPTLLEGPDVFVPMHVSAGSAQTRDIFGDHWRVASADANVDAEARPLATAWTGGPEHRPCGAYRVNRRHEWGEAALTGLSGWDCRAIQLRARRGIADREPLPVAVAAPPLPVFAAPEPGSRMSSADFWAAQRARVASIKAHLKRKWEGRARSGPVRSASK